MRESVPADITSGFCLSTPEAGEGHEWFLCSNYIYLGIWHAILYNKEGVHVRNAWYVLLFVLTLCHVAEFGSSGGCVCGGMVDGGSGGGWLER